MKSKQKPTKFKTQNAKRVQRFRIQDSGFKIQDSGFKIQNPES
jgi:hypothetical protein